MLKNYLTISIRNLQKNLSYSFINIAGLSLGLATCFLILAWITHETSFDRFHKNGPRIYRVSMEYSFGGHVARPSVSPTALLPALLSLPESRSGVRVFNGALQNPYIVSNRDKKFEETRFYFADSTFFNVFTFELMEGNPHKVLSEPNSLVLTQRMAEKYFDGQAATGKMLTINNGQEYKITGVMKDPPSNSLLQFDFIASFHSSAPGKSAPIWWSANYQTFVLLNDKADVDMLEKKTNDIVRDAVARDLTGQNDYVRYNFMPLTDIYLRSDMDEMEAVGDIRQVYIFASIALLILVIASINYINLATARAAGRAREVGIRKVSGALRKQLFGQFMAESFLITFLSFMLALFLAGVFLPFFNSITNKNFTYGELFDPWFIGVASLGLVFISFASGAYPAFALTAFSPVQVLKGNFKTSSRGLWLRKSLVVVQFAISAALIAATLIVNRQLDYISSKKLGFDRENTIILPLDKRTEEVFAMLRTELKRVGAAAFISRGSESPANIKAGYGINTADQQGPGIATAGLLADEEYIPALGMELIGGRNFTAADVERYTRDTVSTFILNEAAVKALFIPLEEAVGSRVTVLERTGEIIGVVKDFHFASLHKPIGPLVIFPQERQFDKILIKLTRGNVNVKLKQIGKIYSGIVTHRPFEFDFLDQQYESLYRNEQRMGKVSMGLSLLGIVIACLGLFGLVSFSSEQKKKEIGIRKTLGATSVGIVILITREFTKLVLIAIVVGLPFAHWIISEHWLNAFAYKPEIGMWPFIFSAVACMFIAFATTAYEAIKASLVDPAETLRNE